MATAPASVGVKIPRRMPPIMMTGSKRGGIACTKALRNSRAVTRPSFVEDVYPRFVEITPQSSIMEIQSRSPGPIPAIKSLPIDTLAMEP